MSKRNHKELWEQLKVIVLLGEKREFTKGELLRLLEDLEITQLAQDPIVKMLMPIGGGEGN